MYQLDNLKSLSTVSDVIQSARDHINQKNFFIARRQNLHPHKQVEKENSKFDLNDIIFRPRHVKMDHIIAHSTTLTKTSNYQLIPLMNNYSTDKLFRATKTIKQKEIWNPAIQPFHQKSCKLHIKLSRKSSSIIKRPPKIILVTEQAEKQPRVNPPSETLNTNRTIKYKGLQRCSNFSQQTLSRWAYNNQDESGYPQ